MIIATFDNDNFILLFKDSNQQNHETPGISITFKSAILKTFSLNFNLPIDGLTMDTFYRGRYEDSGSLAEYLQDKGYYYLEFYEDYSIELFSSQVIVSFSSNT